jgi:hypothetical protein
MAFVPGLTVEVGAPLDSNNPFSYPFIVSNDMVAPLFGVTIFCRYDDVTFDGEATVDQTPVGSEETLSILVPHQKTTAPCQRTFDSTAPLKSGRVTIAVSYFSFLWPFKTSMTRQFTAEINAGEKATWLPQ